MSRWLIRAAVSATAAVILLAVVPLDTVIDAIGRISLGTWTASLGVNFGGHYLNALKLRCLLGQPSVRVSTCVQAQYASVVASLGLPGLAGGDLVRAAYLVPAAGARRVAIASVADRILDTLTLLALVAVALPIAGVPPAVAGMVPAPAGGSRRRPAARLCSSWLRCCCECTPPCPTGSSRHGSTSPRGGPHWPGPSRSRSSCSRRSC